MNVLIVSLNRVQSPYPVAPLGALSVAATTELAGHHVAVLDVSSLRFPAQKIRKAIKNKHYDAIGLSIRNLDNCMYTQPHSYFGEIQRFVSIMCSHTDVPIIAGGSGFSVEPYGWLERLDIPYGIIGEGEKAFPALLERLDSGGGVDDIPGVITTDDRDVDETATSRIHDLDTLVFPSHQYCHYPYYIRHGGFVSVQTKRGCPFSCIYCVYPYLEGTEYRLRSPEAVADEIKEVFTASGARHFFFTDSVFNCPHDHALAVCEAISSRNLEIHWMTYCNPLGFDEELAQAMKQAGCSGIEFGLDAVNDSMLESMGKPFTGEDIKNALSATREAGIPFAVHLLFGAPGETLESMIQTRAFLDTCAPPAAVFASLGIRVYANTPIHKMAVDEGILRPDSGLFEPHYYLSPALGDDAIKKLDILARSRPEWSTPTDWSSPILGLVQKIVNRTGERPQWRNVRNYGKYMRPKTSDDALGI